MVTESGNVKNDAQKKYPDGIIHMFDDLFRVRADMVDYADDGFDQDAKKFVYQNPRQISNGEQLMGKGGTPAEMDSLREAIRTEGLKHPLDCRWHFNGSRIQLIGGSRRKRSIDKLIADKSKCYNPVSREMEPASSVYEYIVCHINEMDDDTALKHAISSNEEGRSIGEGALAALVRHLRQCGKDDDYIRHTLSKSVMWLRQTDEILRLDDRSFDAFCTEKINRTVALKLVAVPDVKRRLLLLGDAAKEASIRIQADIAKHDEQIFKAEKEEEELSGELRAAEEMGVPTDDTEKKISAVKDRIAHHEKAKLAANKKRTNKVIAKDLSNAASGTSDDEVKPLTSVKVRKEWLGTVSALLKSEGKDEDGTEYDLDILHCAKSLIGAYLQGEENITKVLKIIARNQERRAVKAERLVFSFLEAHHGVAVVGFFVRIFCLGWYIIYMNFSTWLRENDDREELPPLEWSDLKSMLHPPYPPGVMENRPGKEFRNWITVDFARWVGGRSYQGYYKQLYIPFGSKCEIRDGQTAIKIAKGIVEQEKGRYNRAYIYRSTAYQGVGVFGDENSNIRFGSGY